jgi:hypothetical protein
MATATAVESLKGIKASLVEATPIHGRMSVPRAQESASVIAGNDLDLGEPQTRIVAYEVPVNDWVEVIYV